MNYKSIMVMLAGFLIWGSGKTFVEKTVGLKNWSQKFRSSLVPNEEQEFDQEIVRYYFDPFHLQMSPFGRTVALSMSGQLNQMWHFGGTHDSWKEIPQDLPIYEKSFLTVRNFEYLRYKRTNRVPQTKAMEKFIRQQTEKLVRGGYLLDPVNYEQFQAYGFFLAELTSRDIDSRAFKALSNFTYEFSKTRSDIVSRMSGMTATVNTLALMQQRNLRNPDFYKVDELVEAANVADEAVAKFVPFYCQFLKGGSVENCSSDFLKVLEDYSIQTIRLQNRNREALINNKRVKLKYDEIPDENFSQAMEKSG